MGDYSDRPIQQPLSPEQAERLSREAVRSHPDSDVAGFSRRRFREGEVVSFKFRYRSDQQWCNGRRHRILYRGHKALKELPEMKVLRSTQEARDEQRAKELTLRKVFDKHCPGLPLNDKTGWIVGPDFCPNEDRM